MKYEHFVEELEKESISDRLNKKNKEKDYTYFVNSRYEYETPPNATVGEIKVEKFFIGIESQKTFDNKIVRDALTKEERMFSSIEHLDSEIEGIQRTGANDIARMKEDEKDYERATPEAKEREAFEKKINDLLGEDTLFEAGVGGEYYYIKDETSDLGEKEVFKHTMYLESPDGGTPEVTIEYNSLEELYADTDNIIEKLKPFVDEKKQEHLDEKESIMVQENEWNILLIDKPKNETILSAIAKNSDVFAVINNPTKEMTKKAMESLGVDNEEQFKEKMASVEYDIQKVGIGLINKKLNADNIKPINKENRKAVLDLTVMNFKNHEIQDSYNGYKELFEDIKKKGGLSQEQLSKAFENINFRPNRRGLVGVGENIIDKMDDKTFLETAMKTRKMNALDVLIGRRGNKLSGNTLLALAENFISRKDEFGTGLEFTDTNAHKLIKKLLESKSPQVNLASYDFKKLSDFALKIRPKKYDDGIYKILETLEKEEERNKKEIKHSKYIVFRDEKEEQNWSSGEKEIRKRDTQYAYTPQTLNDVVEKAKLSVAMGESENRAIVLIDWHSDNKETELFRINKKMEESYKIIEEQKDSPLYKALASKDPTEIQKVMMEEKMFGKEVNNFVELIVDKKEREKIETDSDKIDKATKSAIVSSISNWAKNGKITEAVDLFIEKKVSFDEVKLNDKELSELKSEVGQKLYDENRNQRKSNKLSHKR